MRKKRMSRFAGERIKIRSVLLFLLIVTVLFLAALAPLSYFGNKRTHITYEDGAELERVQTYRFNWIEYVNRCSLIVLFDIAIMASCAVYNLSHKIGIRTRAGNQVS